MQEILLMRLIAILFFGGEPLPDIARRRGKGVRAWPRTLEEPLKADKRQERVQSAPNGSTDNVAHSRRSCWQGSLGAWCTRAGQRGCTKHGGGTVHGLRV